jgi:hypothetical protein
MLHFNDPFLQNSKHVYMNVLHSIAKFLTVEFHVYIQIIRIKLFCSFLPFHVHNIIDVLKSKQ